MRTSSSALKRIELVYGMLEERCSIELQHAHAAFREAQLAINKERDCLQREAGETRDALAQADHQGWIFGKSYPQFGKQRRQQLTSAKEQCERTLSEATSNYHRSRIEREQMRHLVEQSHEQEAVATERSLQMSLDDGFLRLSRRKIFPDDRS